VSFGHGLAADVQPLAQERFTLLGLALFCHGPAQSSQALTDVPVFRN
jgi:hypothetical protein